MIEELLDALAAEPTIERYLVLADALQVHGDPRGELIALDAHARTTGTPRDPRAREIERSLEPKLGAGSTVTWELGFVRELCLPAIHVPEIRFDADELRLLRSLAITDGDIVEHTQPIERIAAAPFRSTLEHLAIGGTKSPLVGDLALLLRAAPALRRIELSSSLQLDDERLRVLEGFAGIEALALWAPGDHALLERLLAARWPRLRALTITATGPGNGDLPGCLLSVLDSTTALTELALFSCGFEHALLEAVAARPQRLTRLGLAWNNVRDERIGDLRDGLAAVELIWPHRPGAPMSFDDAWSFACRLRRLGRLREALDHAKRASLSNVALYSVEAGEIADELDEPEDAFVAMDRATSLDPRDHLGYFGAGKALRKLGRYADSREVLRRGLARIPRSVELHAAMAETLACEGRIDDAIACHLLSIETQTSSGRAFHDRAIAQLQLSVGNLDAARDHIDRARAYDPELAYFAIVDGYIRLARGLPDEAMSIGTQLADHAQDDDDPFELYALRAAAQRALGLPDRAAQLYRRLLAETDCPAKVAVAWLGLAAIGEDPFAPVAAVLDPHALADQIAALSNAARTAPRVHDTVDRCDDRLQCAAAAIGAAIAVGRVDEAHARYDALAAYLRGPAPVKYADDWLEQRELLRAIGTRSHAELLDRTYRLVTGGAYPLP